ncbi:uncharacterized protein LOC110983479 [Acanthaster planci]|uniref:Uncharacterized protein LOC110983479 n=1 Tax=Acanthaster planci TaxID=133434 RepID=A0A8B7Z543_ACAPL|nr:uncharacterized protein LOC110983479 [Acanthaster planci]
MSSTIMVPSFETWKQMILTCTVSLMGMNVSTTIRLRPNGTDVIREFSTTQPPWSYGQVPTSTWKTSNHANTVRIPWSAWISVGVAVLAALVLVLIIATVLLKRQKRVSSGEANRDGSLFRRSSIERTSVSMSPVLSTATQSSGSRLLETAAAVNPRDQNNVPSSSRKKPNSIGSEVGLVYADLEHTRTHAAGAPPIRTECPTNYAEINLSLLSSSVNLPFASSSQDEAPPRPLRGNPIPLLPRHLHL